MKSDCENKYLYIENLGCAKNQVDAEVLACTLEKDGWILTDNADKADLIFVGATFGDANPEDWKEWCSTITGEYIRTGEIAAEFFIKRRFVNFAFFGVKDIIWSEERAQGFRNMLKERDGK